MAEIRVEPKKRSLAWLWVLLALAVIALVAWYLMNDGVNQVDVNPTTSMAPAAAPALPLTPPAPAVAAAPRSGAILG